MRQVMAWAIAILVAIGFCVLNWRYITNFVNGPYEMGPAELATISNVEQASRYFVRVSGSRTEDAGLEEITVTSRSGREVSRRVSARWVALLVGDRWLIVKTESGASTRAEGALLEIPGSVRSKLFGEFSAAEVKETFYPYYLQMEGFRTPGYWGIAVLAAFFGLLVVYGRGSWNRLKDATKHPVLQRIQSWGDPITVSGEIEREFNSGIQIRAGSTVVTDRFLITKTFFNFDVLRFEDLLWAYKKVTKHSVNFIPTGKTFSAVLVCYGGAVELNGNDQKTDELLGVAAAKAPWAIFGYSKEIEELFNKQTAGFCAAVEERRQKLSSA